MRVTVLLFSLLRELAGTDRHELGLPPEATLGEAVDRVGEVFPRLAEWRGPLLLAVNGSYASRETPLAEGDEIALMPPVQGG